MATFVHNEPTSLTIIQEIGLPEAFYKVVESGVEPSFEVIQAIPNALGALCLNQTGQDQLAARPSIIPGLLSIFTSERHLRVLQDKENAVLIGTSIDELIRHHPFLKVAVFEAVRSILGQIEDLGKSFIVPQDIRHLYQLIPDPELPPPEEDQAGAAMDVDQSSTSVLVAPTEDPSAQSEEPEKEGASQKNAESHDNQIVAFIDVIGRVTSSLVILKTAISPTLVFGRAVPAPHTLQGFRREHGWSRAHRSLDWITLPTIRLREQHRIRLPRSGHSHHGRSSDERNSGLPREVGEGIAS
jgi:E3 ubiquitin-protein ligase HUWE1